MHKYATLKEITPGSVIELPKEYQSREGETAVVLGLNYTDEQNITAGFLRDDGVHITEMPAKPDDTKLVLADDRALQASSIKAFVSNKIELPAFNMSCGCDPEIFVEHADGGVFPAWEFMPSEEEARAQSKEWMGQSWKYGVEITTFKSGSAWAEPRDVSCPKKVPSYWDGAQAEFAPWAKTCLETLHYGTREGLKAVLEFARAKDPGAKLTLRNVVELPEAVLKGADDKHIMFRCSQSYNIYNDPGDGVQNPREYKYRCAGGHIHIGYTRKLTAPGIEQLVRGLDGVLGVIGVSLAAGIDNPERRHTYGRAGEFRLPQHGLEYRVLSNFWLSHPALAMLVFEIARASIRLAESGLFNLCWVASEQETREVINNCDVEGARKILRRNVAVLEGMLNGIWDLPAICGPDKMRALAMKTILNGMDVAIKDPLDVEGNWKINNPDGWNNHCRGKGDSWRSLANL